MQVTSDDENLSITDASSDETQRPTKQDDSDEAILRLARDRFTLATESELEIRQMAVEDAKFAAGEQWSDEIRAARDSDGRPCLTINRLPQFIRQITNDQKQNRPAIKVSPVDDKADIETAKIFQGLIRHIEHASDADIAWDTAFEHAVRSGFGFVRIVTEYADAQSFDLEIKFKRVRNAGSAYLDPSYQQPDGSDAHWGFVFDDVSKDEYKSMFPESKAASMDDWTSVGNNRSGWATKDTIRIAEYFYKVYEEKELVELSDGTVAEASQLANVELPPEITVKNRRKVMAPKVMWLKINAVEVLERTEWPSQYIPIIPVLGEELEIDGRRILEGIVRHAKDSQRMYNFWASNEAETIALAPRAPWIGVEGQFDGFKEQWATANRKNHAYLEYKGKSVGGVPVGPPQRNVFEPPVQAISNARMLAAEDLKATTGIYDAAVGAQSNEKSGIAIQRRANQSQTSNFHFMDNLSKSRRHAGRILLELIPVVYDVPRAVRCLGEDGSVDMKRVNEIFMDHGQEKIHDLSIGRYDVTIGSGPSFETKRQEAVQSMLDLSRAYPQIMQVAGDILVNNMDWPQSQEIAARLKKSLPPQFQDDNKEQMPIPPQVQAQMAQLQDMNKQLTEHLNQKSQMVEQKTLELESKERIEMMKLKFNAEIALAQLGSKEAVTLLGHQIGEIAQRQSLLKINEPIGAETEEQNEAPMQAPQGPSPMQMNQEQMPTGGPQSPGQPIGV